MAGADSAAGARVGGLLISLKRLVATSLAMAETRLELLTGEVDAESRRLTHLLMLGAVAAVFLAGGVLLLSLLIIVFYWDSNRLMSIGALTVLYFAVGAGFAAATRRSAATGSSLFKTSLSELRKDRDRLSA
jgi:uncharacterized membrane protein YqjE